MRANILALLLFAFPALAEDAKVSCNLDAAAVIICESGGRTFRVIREALSRTGRHAVTPRRHLGARRPEGQGQDLLHMKREKENLTATLTSIKRHPG